MPNANTTGQSDITPYSELVREALRYPFPTPSPRNDIIRSIPEPRPFNRVHIITGVRRCGKTFYLFQLIHDLLHRGVQPNRIFYFNFADDRLRPAPPSAMSDIIEEYWRQVPDARTGGAYLLLDEVQEQYSWQGVCQRLAEHERVTLVITGSSSKVSSEEIATQFRGRSQSHLMLPLSFGEYCRFHGLETSGLENDAFSPAERTRLEAAYDDFLTVGGFPGIQADALPDRIEVLQGYVRDVVTRDIAERLGRADLTSALLIALFALRNTSCELSINGYVEELSRTGRGMGWEKARDIVDLLESANLFYRVPEFNTSLKTTTATPKAYAVDQGLAYAVARANQQDMGKRLETAIFLELKRRLAGSRTDTVTSYTERGPRSRKVDFVVGDMTSSEPYEPYQVCLSMGQDKTRARELGSIDAVMRETGLGHGTIVTLREEGAARLDSGTVDIVPAWKWALEHDG